MGNLASAVDELLMLDPRSLPAPALAEHLVELSRQINRARSAYFSALEAFDRSGAAMADHGSTAAWVRAELHMSPGPATRDVHLARDLADVLPATRAAMADGELSAEHAQVIASLKTAINPDALAAAEPHLVEWAVKASPKELRKVAAHVRHSYAPTRMVRDEAEEYAARRLDASTTIHGIGVGSFTLHPHGHELFMTAIHAASRPVTGDDRTPAQRRADALITIAELALNSGELPVTGGVKPHVTVTTTLASHAGEPGSPAAEYTFGAVTSTEWARRTSCDAEISRVVFGPRGEILDSGRAARTFSAAQVRAIVARDQHCIWPGCDAPAGWCQAHHIIHWADGGRTSVANAALLCGRHHDRVHARGHRIDKTPDGKLTVCPVSETDPRWLGRPPQTRAGP